VAEVRRVSVGLSKVEGNIKFNVSYEVFTTVLLLLLLVLVAVSAGQVEPGFK